MRRTLSANLDRAYALDIYGIIQNLHERAPTVIVAAHDETLMADYGHPRFAPTGRQVCRMKHYLSLHLESRNAARHFIR